MFIDFLMPLEQISFCSEAQNNTWKNISNDFLVNKTESGWSWKIFRNKEFLDFLPKEFNSSKYFKTRAEALKDLKELLIQSISSKNFNQIDFSLKKLNLSVYYCYVGNKKTNILMYGNKNQWCLDSQLLQHISICTKEKFVSQSYPTRKKAIQYLYSVLDKHLLNFVNQSYALKTINTVDPEWWQDFINPGIDLDTLKV